MATLAKAYVDFAERNPALYDAMFLEGSVTAARCPGGPVRGTLTAPCRAVWAALRRGRRRRSDIGWGAPG
ncbi:TetR-like C-terminal domain-containing protein [Streptomyces platensis]|uniref:TetR-like C-terminal domain-containing protein n=1 Tax=Streptomyces platensis TaxID=58346 RepID=UPI00368726C4